MSDVKTKLDELDEIRTSLDTLASAKQALIDTILTPEIKAKIAEIEAEFSGKAEAANTNAAALEAEIKQLVLTGAETVKGDHLMAVWAKGRVTWDAKSLDGFALAHQELLSFRKEGEPSVSIRRI